MYRPDGATDQYLLALNDAGRGISVAKADLVDIVSKSSAPSYSVEFVDVNSHRGYGTFSKLPPAAQALWLLEHGTVLYSARTWGKDRKIDINSDGEVKRIEVWSYIRPFGRFSPFCVAALGPTELLLEAVSSLS